MTRLKRCHPVPVARASAGAHASVEATTPTTACFAQYAPITDGFTLDADTEQYKYTGGQYPYSWGGHFTVNTCNGG